MHALANSIVLMSTYSAESTYLYELGMLSRRAEEPSHLEIEPHTPSSHTRTQLPNRPTIHQYQETHARTRHNQSPTKPHPLKVQAGASYPTRPRSAASLNSCCAGVHVRRRRFPRLLARTYFIDLFIIHGIKLLHYYSDRFVSYVRAGNKTGRPERVSRMNPTRPQPACRGACVYRSRSYAQSTLPLRDHFVHKNTRFCFGLVRARAVLFLI
jgi:hypothetical protein